MNTSSAARVPDEAGAPAPTDEPDYANSAESWASLVPKETFSADPEEQKVQIEQSPLLDRFARSRARLAYDRYRPLFHFVSPESRLNDPNALCFWQDEWHLFYQAYPPEDPRQHWGHTVSPDLIHWRDLPYAIYPGPEHAVFSGSALVESDRVIAMYHGEAMGNFVAISEDPLLLNWTNVGDGAVIPIEGAYGLPDSYNVFDPAIWRKDGLYYSLSAGKGPVGPGGRDVASGSLFRSADLTNWEYLHEFVEDDRFTLIDDDYACPYFLPIGDRHILLFFSHATGGQYLLGDYDTTRDKLVATHAGRFNFGASTPSGVHAPSAASDGTGGVVVVFNMNAGKPTGEWDQIFTLPRVLRLDGDGRLIQQPVPGVESLRGAGHQIGPLSLPANEEIVLASIAGNSIELELEIDVCDGPMVEVRVLRSIDAAEYTRIMFMRNRGASRGRGYRPRDETGGAARPRESLITIDTSHSSLAPDVRPRGPETASFALDDGENLRMRVFIDRSLVEVFVNDRQAVATRVYPSREDSIGVSLLSKGTASELVRLNAWTMKTIYAE